MVQAEFPSSDDMLTTFGIEPTTAVPEDGVWCYEFSDDFGVALRLSWDVLQCSVQTILMVHAREIASVCQEGADYLRIRKDMAGSNLLLGEFTSDVVQTHLKITLQPAITVTWSSLIVRG